MGLNKIKGCHDSLPPFVLDRQGPEMGQWLDGVPKWEGTLVDTLPFHLVSATNLSIIVLEIGGREFSHVLTN